MRRWEWLVKLVMTAVVLARSAKTAMSLRMFAPATTQTGFHVIPATEKEISMMHPEDLQ